MDAVSDPSAAHLPADDSGATRDHIARPPLSRGRCSRQGARSLRQSSCSRGLSTATLAMSRSSRESHLSWAPTRGHMLAAPQPLRDHAGAPVDGQPDSHSSLARTVGGSPTPAPPASAPGSRTADAPAQPVAGGPVRRPTVTLLLGPRAAVRVSGFLSGALRDLLRL